MYFEPSHSATQALAGELTVPSWEDFCTQLTEIFNMVQANTGGSVATYIPSLGKVDPDQFAVSVCTVDGQRFSIGDTDVLFGVQSCSKPVSYCMALREHGSEVVHSQVSLQSCCCCCTTPWVERHIPRADRLSLSLSASFSCVCCREMVQ